MSAFPPMALLRPAGGVRVGLCLCMSVCVSMNAVQSGTNSFGHLFFGVQASRVEKEWRAHSTMQTQNKSKKKSGKKAMPKGNT